MAKKNYSEEPEEVVEGEAEIAKEANKSVLESMKDMEERKEKAKESIKAFKADTSVPEGTPKAPREPTVRDTARMDTFKSKLIKDFGLNEKVDSHGCVQLKLKNFNVLKLLPRKGWYGVWREDPSQDNKTHAFRVASESDEQTHYEFVKDFVKANTEEA
jgi:hypothetical protein